MNIYIIFIFIIIFLNIFNRSNLVFYNIKFINHFKINEYPLYTLHLLYLLTFITFYYFPEIHIMIIF